MSFVIRVRPDPEREVEDLFHWFEGQARGLGRRFVSELDAVYSRVEENPLLYEKIYRDTRRAMLRKFPVGVFYNQRDQVVQVIAVSHLARNPIVWKRRS